MTAAQVLTLTGASLTPGGVELTASTPQGVTRRVFYPRPVLAQVLTVESEGAAPVYALTLYTAPPLARRLLAGVHVEPHTPEGAAALAVLGVELPPSAAQLTPQRCTLMTEQNPAPRSPAALAEVLGLTVPQLAQHLASITQGEGLTAQGVTLNTDRMGQGRRAHHLTAAEVLAVLAVCPGTAQPEPARVLDVTHPFFSRASELCWAVEHYLAGEASRAELGAAAARLMPLLGFAPERAQAVRAAAGGAQ